MSKIHVFLRKKRKGENSMEMLMSQYAAYNFNIKVFELPYHSTSFQGIINNIKFVRKNKGDYNWVYSIGDGYLSLFLKKCIVTIHDVDSFRNLNLVPKIYSYLINFYIPSLKRNIKYHCISNYTKTQFLNVLPFKKNNTFVSHNPIDNSFVNSDKILKETPKKDKVILLHVGTGKRKNLEAVIEAIQEDPKYKILIVGVLSDYQKELLSKYSIDFENFIDLPKGDLINLYRQSDIVTFPSNCEGFGMIVIEANAMGKPIIAGDIEVLHEVGKDSALYVTPGDVEEIKKSLHLLLNNEDFKRNMIRRGLKNIKRFNIKKLNKEILEQFSNL